MNARSRTSFDSVTVHAFQSDGGIALRSVCGGLTTMPYLLDVTEEPVTCVGCGAAWVGPCPEKPSVHAARTSENSGQLGLF